MTCPPGSERSFGPRIDTACRSFDFTLQFEDIVFACLPAVLFLVLAIAHVFTLLRLPLVASRSMVLLASKLIDLTGILGLQLTLLVLRTQNTSLQTNVSVTAEVLAMIATGAALTVSFLSHQRSLRPSTLLSLYLSAYAILNIARTRTLWLLEYGSPEAAVGTATLVLVSTALLLESIEDRANLKKDKRSEAPEKYSGFWNRTSFSWLAATFRMGYAGIISVDDLPALDTKLASRTLREQLVSTWVRYNRQDRHGLLRASLRSYLPSFLSGIIPRLCLTAFTFSQPFLIDTTVTFVGQSEPDGNYGKGLIGAWGLVYLGIAVSHSIYSYQNFRFTTRLRGGLIALVYQQTLQTRAVDQGEITAVALMGTDVERIVYGMSMLHEVWATLLDIAIASWLLERQLSLAFIAPIVLVLGFIAATSKLSLASKTAQKRWIEKVQERLRVTSAMLGDMKAVKMLGLPQVMSTMIQKLRIDEIETSKNFRQILVATVLFSLTPINLAPVVTFAIYTIISLYWKDETLLTAQAFTSIALITLLTNPVIVFIQGLPQVVQSVASFDRIQDFCNYSTTQEALESDSLPVQSPTGSINLQYLAHGDNAQQVQLSNHQLFTLEDKSFGWSKNGPAILKNLRLNIHRGDVTALIGPVGSGKSALLNSLLGEMAAISASPEQTQRERTRTELIAYCSQQPWLENGTIRQNIIGVSRYDRKWYDAVTSACGLDVDITQLEKRDCTRVGSKGLNLSGGQKQRIALARAVYANKRVILLDDVFSGMDAHTADLVSNRLLGNHGLLRKPNLTVVLVTHNLKIVTLSDTVIRFEDGNIAETGSPATLLQSDSYIRKAGLSLPSSDENVTESPNVDSCETAPEALRVSIDAAEETESLLTDMRRKNGDMSIYKYYIASSGYSTTAWFVIFMVVWVFCTEFSTIWVKWWSEANTEQGNKNVGTYVGVYAMLGAVGTFGACVTAWFGFVPMISKSAARLHSDILEATLRAPFRFFATADNGDLLNRFSKDMELIDMDLPSSLINYTSTVLACVATIVIIAVFSKYLGATLPFIGTALYFLQRFYLQTSRQVRLLGIEAQAPLYTHFSESVAGSATIRAFGWQSHYQERNYRRIDTSQRPEYLQGCIQHWLAFVLETMVAALAVILVATVVTWRDKFSAGSVGVSLVMVVGFSEKLARLIQSWTRLESSIGAAARIKRFAADTESEEGSRDVGSIGRDECVLLGWPATGALEFTDVVASYGPGREAALKGISMAIQPRQHIAICGRSGSGKSSLVLSLLQMVDIRRGQIVLDGMDLSAIACADVRSRINVVPQDPFLMPGTIRFNIDPMAMAADSDIVRALERVRLWTTVRDQGGLDKEMDAEAWSAGQKQLLCFARAMVRRCGIVVLDEAMSSADDETESVMQEIIDSEFKDCTVLAVMHRLGHVQSYDRVALMDNGVLLEFDAPAKLLGENSRFAELYRSSE